MIDLLAEAALFRDPIPGSWNYWYLMLLPLALLVSIVYKGMRCDGLSELPRQTLRAFLKFTVGFVILAAVLWLIMLLQE